MRTRRLLRPDPLAQLVLICNLIGMTAAAAGEPVGARVVVTHGRPGVVHDGVLVSQAAFLDRMPVGDWKERHQDIVNDGIKVFHFMAHGRPGDYFTTEFWAGDGVYPQEDPDAKPHSLDGQARAFLALQPDARFYVDFNCSAPPEWAEKHPDHIQTDEDGHTHREATLASELNLIGLTHYLSNVVRYCESRPWADRIVGYKLTPHGEGCMPLVLSGKMFDCSPENERAFRKWLRGRYTDEEALRKAWNDPSVTFDGARVPRDGEWLARRTAATPTIGGEPLGEKHAMHGKGYFHWIEPANARREHDYAAFMRDNFLRWVRTMVGAIKAQCAVSGRSRVVGLDIAKQPLMGWQIQSAFGGMGDGLNFPNVLFLSGSYDVGELLDDADLDFIWTPADYTARAVGFAYEAEGVSDSLVLRGKAMIVENDARTHAGGGRTNQGAFRNQEETEAGLVRNAALTLSRGLQSYWCNFGHLKSNTYFGTPAIHDTLARVTAMLDRLNTAPHRETRDAIAMIIDDASPLYEDFTSGYQYLAVVWQRILGLAHCGVPYRIYLLSDLEKDNFPNYKVYLFPNLFKVDDAVMALLRRKVLRDGNVAIFGPATGITDGEHLGASKASELLGVPMELAPYSAQRHVIVRDQGHAIGRKLPANLTYGDSLVYGPLLVPEHDAVAKAGGVVLGAGVECFPVNRTGLFLKECGEGAAGNGTRGSRGPDDYAMVWSVAMPLPANLLREIARYAGCNIWSEQNDVIYASESIVAIHSAQGGPRAIRLPRRCKVRDAMTGKRVGWNRRAIKVELSAPDTRIFELE